MSPCSRIVSVVVLVLIGLAGTGTAGHAKGPVDVIVSGPGIAERHLTVTGALDDLDAGSLAAAARIHDIYRPGRLPAAPPLARDELGPRYVLTWPFDARRVVVQHAYPFAEGGAWVRILPGQRLWGEPVTSGWTAAPGLTELLVELGAEAPAPEADASAPVTAVTQRPVPPSAAADSWSAYAVAVPLGVLAAGALVAGGLVVRRRGFSR